MINSVTGIAADWTYTFKPDEHGVNKSQSATEISELCSISSPRLLHKYANRTIYETHLSILTNIESAMLLSVGSSEYTWYAPSYVIVNFKFILGMHFYYHCVFVMHFLSRLSDA